MTMTMTMTEVENHNKMDDDDHRDQFPIGMRVLAVDDDPTCLRVLEAMLRKCQYNVTATKSAMTALQLLRENKNKFDLVISDVHMPIMDGFKLLELVGLEMDIPVILLSYNGDPKMVMKGITHGACQYLLKPVRVEELMTIWQHVFRNKKIGSKEGPKTGSNQDTLNSDSDNGQGLAETTNSDQNGKASKKRKYHKEDVDDEEHESSNDSENQSAQKKPRFVWSVELQRKFEAAVLQLGIDKAVPKKILEMMNVEKLTRENVASHLQKYRLHLKRISSVVNQQANPRLGSQRGSWQFCKNPDGPATLNNMHGLPSSGTIQVDQLQHNNGVSHLQNLSNAFLFEENPQDKQIGGVSTSLAPQHDGWSKFFAK